MALRLSSNLMLGVVRIFSRKTRYLWQESEDALTRVKLAFGEGRRVKGKLISGVGKGIDLEEGGDKRGARIDMYTIGEVYDYTNETLELRKGMMGGMNGYRAREGDITIREDEGIGAGVIDMFGMDFEAERGLELRAGMEEEMQRVPLIFTPERARELSEGAPSVEIFREAPSVPAVESEPGLEISPAVSFEKKSVISVGREPEVEVPPPVMEAEEVGPVPRVSVESVPPEELAAPPAVPEAVEEEAVEIVPRFSVEVEEEEEARERRGRKRKIDEIADMVDKEIELPTKVLRAGMRNTSDIVVPDIELSRRELVPTKKREREQQAETVLKNMVPGFGDTADLAEIFQDCYQPAIDVTTGVAVVPEVPEEIPSPEVPRVPAPAEIPEEVPVPEAPPSIPPSVERPPSISSRIAESPAVSTVPPSVPSIPSEEIQPVPLPEEAPEVVPVPLVPEIEGRLTLKTVSETPATVPEGERVERDGVSIRTRRMAEFIRDNIVEEVEESLRSIFLNKLDRRWTYREEL